MSAPRFEARSAMLWRVSLSAGARLLYLAIDDMARERGSWFIRQAQLSTQLGFSQRAIRYYLAELVAAGHVIAGRTGRSAVYRLAWAADRQPVADHDTARSATDCLSDRQPVADRILLENSGTFYPERTAVCVVTICVNCGEFHESSERVRCRCGHVHDPAGQPEVDEIEVTRKYLHDYVRRSGLDWLEPDTEICQRVLIAAGGIVALIGQLRHLLLDRKQKPGQSYAWFEKAAATESGRHRRLSA